MNKNIPILFTFLFLMLNLIALAQSNVGISITLPTEKLHVDSGAIKVGNNVWTPGIDHHWIKFGDGDFVKIGEDSLDDKMIFSAENFVFLPSIPGYFANVGIGELNPTAKLDLVGSFKYRDGNETEGKVLTSDFLGNATWQSANNFAGVPMKICMAITGTFPSPGIGSASDDIYLGEIKVFPYSFVPQGFIECKGQLLNITTNAALFSIIGTTYGGNGTTNFAVPNLTNKVVIGQ
jgi:Phage Tail Collar Domain